VTFEYDDVEQWGAVAAGDREGDIYSRNTNPTVRAFEQVAAALEGAPAAIGFASGMAAISNTLLALLSPGDRVVSVRDTYGGTHKIFTESLPRFGVDVELCDTDDHEALEWEIARGCDVLYLESPTNPTLKILDLERLAAAGHEVGATVVVDNTFATPINQRPLELGADLAVHSATKFFGGHSDVLGGVACGSEELTERLFHFREIHGAALDAEAAYYLLRGTRTMELRVLRQNESAGRIARFLGERAEVEEVFYPGLPDDAGHEIARRQMSGFGGILSFSLRGGLEAVSDVLPRLRLAHRAASLGSVSTLVGPPATTSHVELDAEERAAAGIPEGLVRYSVGIENVEDLLDDLGQALDGLELEG
jgi:cystathionine gamma-synthase